MREKTLAIIITTILIVIGLILAFLQITLKTTNTSLLTYNEFNFYKSELTIEENKISEKLYFNTDKKYHTLFRNFQSKLSLSTQNFPNSITINKVSCSSGKPYFRLNSKCYYEPDFTNQESCLPYTEDNEYGCTFGNTYGFKSNTNYILESEFTLNPENLFKINNNHYIKFIAYGKNNHIDLKTNNNLIIIGKNTHTNTYAPNEYVIIYIPYTGDTTNFKIIEKNDFEYDSKDYNLNPLYIILILLMHLVPAFIFYFTWSYFGKELTNPDIPDQLSQIPNKRKPWQVAAYFNPPFSVIDKNFFSATLLDFYRQKIIDLKSKKGFFSKHLLIKIKNINPKLDTVEKNFFDILKYLNDSANENNKEGEFFNIYKVSKQFGMSINMKFHHVVLKDSIKKESKKYIENKGILFFLLFTVILIIISMISQLFVLTFFSFITLFTIIIISSFTTLLLRYKERFYHEYKEWQSFKKWLSYSPSMKEHGHKGVIFWEEFLVYATSLGVAKKVLKELRKQHVISDKQYNTHLNVHMATMSFASSGGGSGFSGGGGGGVGGGGGGGR
ncbi:DUF2207 domain-containing protein [Candidatus Pacearchaeota archaeon]|nr:DUF2207 domain-containing protein [Candidatus Pacearchaeota archaeon]